MKKISFNHIRWILVTIFIVYIASFAYIYVFKFEVKEKGLQYLEPIEIVELLKFNSGQIANLREGKFILYKAKVADLYKNITISLFICLLGALVLSRKEDIEFPGFPSLKIPISITYIIVPGALCYYWLQFGFLLHRIISTRIGLTRLIDAEYMIINKIDKKVTIPYKNYYTVTHSNNLMDVGFIDSWFVTFLPEHFKTAPMFGFDNFVITGTMITVGILYGISHGFSLGLPLNWIRRYSNSKRRFIILAYTLLFVNILFIGSSHLTFCFTGNNRNWLHFVILVVGLSVFYLITTKTICDLHNDKKKP